MKTSSTLLLLLMLCVSLLPQLEGKNYFPLGSGEKYYFPLDGEKLYFLRMTQVNRDMSGFQMLDNALSKYDVSKIIKLSPASPDGSKASEWKPIINTEEDGEISVTIGVLLEFDIEKYKEMIIPLKDVLEKISRKTDQCNIITGKSVEYYEYRPDGELQFYGRVKEKEKKGLIAAYDVGINRDRTGKDGREDKQGPIYSPRYKRDYLTLVVNISPSISIVSNSNYRYYLIPMTKEEEEIIYKKYCKKGLKIKILFKNENGEEICSNDWESKHAEGNGINHMYKDDYYIITPLFMHDYYMGPGKGIFMVSRKIDITIKGNKSMIESISSFDLSVEQVDKVDNR